MRVVLDTNSLLVSIGKRSKYRPIFDAILQGKLKLVISNDIITEYVEIIEDKTNSEVAENIARFLIRSPDVSKVQVDFKWSMIVADADDNKFVDCALNANVDYLVTDDKHFNVIKGVGFPPLTVIKTSDFLEIVMTQIV